MYCVINIDIYTFTCMCAVAIYVFMWYVFSIYGCMYVYDLYICMHECESIYVGMYVCELMELCICWGRPLVYRALSMSMYIYIYAMLYVEENCTLNSFVYVFVHVLLIGCSIYVT